MTTEKRYEDYIESCLTATEDHGLKYRSIHFHAYDRATCLIHDEVLAFVKTTQPDAYDQLTVQYGADTDKQFIRRLSGEITKRGVIDVLRNGVTDRGAYFDLVYFQPKSGLNRLHRDRYLQNRFSVVRQLHYSLRNERSIDLVLFLNGIPIVTIELKNQLSGQNVSHANRQYRLDRNPKGEPLLQFGRCIVHFSVDNDTVHMTTRLQGANTRFLPYNKALRNPTDAEGYRVAYLWKEVLTPTSLLDILENFVVEVEEWEKEWDGRQGRVVEKRSKALIFPRYHQWEVIRRLRSTIIAEGVGHNYLIQHTTGSGKSYSMGWLAHLLTSLYRSDTDTHRLFDSVIVITDRRVLDKQLQHTIKQLEQTQGVVNPVDLTSAQLEDFLGKGKDIIITTIQKFGVIVDRIATLKGRKFGVIIDEVHSSQSGESAKNLKKTLSFDEQEDDTEDVEERIGKEIRARGQQEHISFFGFTGTPKNKTLELFGRKNADGQFVPFHTYTMKQSIFEGFTLDVLKHYTTYQRWFRVVQKRPEDEELPESRVKRQLVEFVDSHEETIRQKCHIILDQFVRQTAKRINGQARAMVVVRSRYHCVLFHQALKTQMRERNLPYSCLVAFSGAIRHMGREVTETTLNHENGVAPRVSIPEAFKDPRFRILIVSSKFQTGFDEPLVHTMFVDKKLSGVQCVQTLSRLNRTKKGKTDTFVLDFANEEEDIISSFQPYYTSTLLSHETEPNKLYDVETTIRGFDLFTQYDIDAFCTAFFSPHRTDEQLQPPLNSVVDRWSAIDDEDRREEFRSVIHSYCRLYAYISQIMTFEDINLEKLFVFLNYLKRKLPKRDADRIDISDLIDLDSLRIQKIGEMELKLEDATGVMEPMSEYGSKGKNEEAVDLLSEIIKVINEHYGIDLTDEDKLDLQNVQRRLNEDQEVLKVMTSDNSEMDKKQSWYEKMDEILIDYVNDRVEFYNKMNNTKIKNLISEKMYKEYRQRLP